MLPLYHCILCYRNTDRANGQLHHHAHLESNKLFFQGTCTSYSVIFGTRIQFYARCCYTKLHYITLAVYNSVLDRIRCAHVPNLEKVAWHKQKTKENYLHVNGKDKRLYRSKEINQWVPHSIKDSAVAKTMREKSLYGIFAVLVILDD